MKIALIDSDRERCGIRPAQNHRQHWQHKDPTCPYCVEFFVQLEDQCA